MIAILASLVSSSIAKWAGMIISLLGLLWLTRKGGQIKAKNQAINKTLEAEEKSHAVENKVNAMSADAITNELRKDWTRD